MKVAEVMESLSGLTRAVSGISQERHACPRNVIHESGTMCHASLQAATRWSRNGPGVVQGVVQGVVLGVARLTLRRCTWPINNPADSLRLRRLRSPCHSSHPSSTLAVRGPCSGCC